MHARTWSIYSLRYGGAQSGTAALVVVDAVAGSRVQGHGCHALSANGSSLGHIGHELLSRVFNLAVEYDLGIANGHWRVAATYLGHGTPLRTLSLSATAPEV